MALTVTLQQNLNCIETQFSHNVMYNNKIPPPLKPCIKLKVMKKINVLFFIGLLVTTSFFSCKKVDISKDLKKDMVGKTWMATHMRDSNGEVFENASYSLSSFYEQGFKLKANGNYIPKYLNDINRKSNGHWYLNDNETELIIDNENGAIYSYQIIDVSSDTLELFFSGGYLILIRE